MATRKRLVTIVVDYRESELLKQLRETNKPAIEEGTPDVGDIVFKCDDKVIGFIVERKTTADLSASIHDKRSKEQTWRLARAADEAGVGVLFVIEGRLRPAFGPEDQDYMLPYKNLRGSMLNRLIGDGMSWIETDSTKHTVDFLLEIRDKLETLNVGKEIRTMRYEDVMNNVRKRSFATPDAMRIQALSLCQGMSNERARAILDEYGTPAEIVRRCEATDPEFRLSVLQNLRAGASGRRIGPTLAKNVLDFLGVEYEELMPPSKRQRKRKLHRRISDEEEDEQEILEQVQTDTAADMLCDLAGQ